MVRTEDDFAPHRSRSSGFGAGAAPGGVTGAGGEGEADEEGLGEEAEAGSGRATPARGPHGEYQALWPQSLGVSQAPSHAPSVHALQGCADGDSDGGSEGGAAGGRGGGGGGGEGVVAAEARVRELEAEVERLRAELQLAWQQQVGGPVGGCRDRGSWGVCTQGRAAGGSRLCGRAAQGMAAGCCRLWGGGLRQGVGLLGW